MWSGRLRLQQYFMALLASLLKTTRKKKTNGPWRVGAAEKKRSQEKEGTSGSGGGRGAHLQTVEAGEQVVEEDDVAVDGEQS